MSEAVWNPTPPTVTIEVAGGAGDPTPPSAASAVPGTVLVGTPWTTANFFKGGALLDGEGATLGVGRIAGSSWNAGTSQITVTVPDGDGSLTAEDPVVLFSKNGHKFTAEYVSASGGGEDPYSVVLTDPESVAQGALTNPVPPTVAIDPEA